MLKLKHLFENYALAKEALQYWAHDEETLDEMLGEFRISSNAIYPFYRDGRVQLLRLAPTDEKLLQNIVGELEFLEYLRAADYPALRVVPTDAGEPYLTLDTAFGTYYAEVFARVPGTSLEDVAPTRDILHAYGRALGELHALSAAYVPRTRKWSHEDALQWIGDVLTEYGAPECAKRELTAVRQGLAALPRWNSNYGLVHYDFEPDNVFYDETTGRCWAIDFDDGMYHWFALDIEQALDSLSDVLEGEALAAAKAPFLAGYRTAYPFREEDDATRPLMRRFIDLYAYARLIRSVAERFPDEPDWLVSLREKLGNAIAKKEAGFLK